MSENVNREVRNISICLHPYVSVQQEEAYLKNEIENGPRFDQIQFKLRKAMMEARQMGPAPLSDSYKPLYKGEKWDLK